MQAELTKKIRALAEAEALGHVVCNQQDDLTYDGFMEAENVHEYADIWGPVSGLSSEDLQEMCETEADIFVGFAEAVIRTMTVDDLLKEIRSRNTEKAIIVWSSEDVLGVAEKMGEVLSEQEVRDVLSLIEKWHDAEYGITWETLRSSVDCVISKRASAFGISYVNGY